MCLAGSELRFAFSMRRVNLCKLCTLCADESTWFCMNFHKLRLIGRRAALNLTQEELAKRAGVSLRSVAAWEAGTQQPTLRMVHLLATALGCPYAWLLGESESSMVTASENAPGSARVRSASWPGWRSSAMRSSTASSRFFSGSSRRCAAGVRRPRARGTLSQPSMPRSLAPTRTGLARWMR